MISTRRALFAILCGLAVSAACGGTSTDESGAADGSGEARAADVSTLQVTDTQAGTGVEATPGRQVTVHYTGWLYDPSAPNQRGAKFDSSVDRGQPFEFRLGAAQVIQGWDEGVAGMKVGGKRTLVIPSGMAYGPNGAGGVIPPGAALVFDVELLGVS
jgi:FKBP-type peptidyl-prolyl cis-trans isomerase FkpA